MRDFTGESYTQLLFVLNGSGYCFQTFKEYLTEPKDKVAILRHDVDKLPLNSLIFAQIEHRKGIQASYYFRIVKESLKPSIIRQIHTLGHEIGYHYEDMDIYGGDVDKAYKSFQSNLARLREIVSVDTACMHGSPLSRFDNRDLWKKYDYHDDGIIGEPYFDIDYCKVFYLTDTGRNWNAIESSIRDKVQSPYSIQVKHTFHLIQLIKDGKLPNQLMINTHPQRWNDNFALWTKELIIQGIKNQVKNVIVRHKLSQNKEV